MNTISNLLELSRLTKIVEKLESARPTPVTIEGKTYAWHHTCTGKRFAKRFYTNIGGRLFKPYSGRFGVGFIELLCSPKNSSFDTISYYIL